MSMNLSDLYSDLKVKYDNLKNQAIRQEAAIAEQNKIIAGQGIEISALQKEVAANKQGIVTVGDDIFLIERAKIPQGFSMYVSMKKYTALYKVLNPTT